VKLVFAIKNLALGVGGAERVFCSICSSLVERGHTVYVLTFDEPGSKSFYGLDSRIIKISIDLGDSRSKSGFIVTLLRMMNLRKILLQIRPDFTIGFMHSMYIPIGLALIGTKMPVIGSEHIVIEHYKTRPIQYMLLILASPFIRKITVLSKKIRKGYPSCVQRKMMVVPNPVMTADSRVNLNSTKITHVLLTVGRLCEQKDQKTLILAFHIINRKYPGWVLRIVGDGPLRFELEQLVSSLGMQKRVCFVGITSNIQLEYEQADVFVIPSKYEAFGLVTAEAMSYGLPVIGFKDCPGTNELISSEINGILVSSQSNRVNALALALERVLSDQQLRIRLGGEAAKEINNKFSLGFVSDRWEFLLRHQSKNHIEFESLK
jgi:glycosyltransferase involved in cell wall biosynthesis